MLIYKLKSYPKHSQGGDYLSGVQPTTSGYTPGGEYVDANGVDYVGAWHMHTNGVITKGAIQTHTDIVNEEEIFPITSTSTSTTNTNTSTSTSTTNTNTQSSNTTVVFRDATGTLSTNQSNNRSVDTSGNESYSPQSEAAPKGYNKKPPVGAPPPPPAYINPLPALLPDNEQQGYLNNGLTYITNLETVSTRNTARSLQFEENEPGVSSLIIEPIIETYTNKSFISAIDTQFKFFKFPARIGVDGELNLDLTSSFDIADTGIDLVSGFHSVIAADATPTIGAIGTRLSVNDTFSGEKPNFIPFNKTLAGASLDTQLYTFILTPEKIKFIRDGGKALKFSISGTYYTLANVNTRFGLMIDRSNMPNGWRKFEDEGYDGLESISGLSGKYASSQYTTLQKMQETPTNSPNYTSDHRQIYVYLRSEFVVDPDKMFDYDQYVGKHITSNSNGKCIVSGVNLQVSLIDDPGPNRYGNFATRSNRYSLRP